MLARVYEMKGELRLFFEAHGDTRSSFSQPNQKFYLTLANLVDIFEALNG